MLTRGDKILITGLLVAAVLGLVVVRYKGQTHRFVTTAVVRVDGKEAIRTSLAEDRRFSVDGLLGKTEVEIKDRRVRVMDSPCNRKICVRTGWIHKPYQTIICAPNRVVINLLGNRDHDKLDGVTE